MDHQAGEFAPTTDELLYERRGPVALLTFNRPQAHNALTPAMFQGLFDLCDHVAERDDIRVLVLRGAGDRAFVSGADISRFRSFSTADDVRRYLNEGASARERLETLRKPTIAMIHGYCAGGGAGIALACDLRIASTEAKFGMPIARTLGNALNGVNLRRMMALIGPARTLDLIYTARFMAADEGRMAGLYVDVVDPAELEARTLELANRIAQHAPLTLAATKLAIRRILDAVPEVDVDDLVLGCYLSADFKEGVEAFLGKRKPVWTGR